MEQKPLVISRLNKYISNSGICSRRDADIYIKTGHVKVNNNLITEMGYKVKEGDIVKFDNKIINPEEKEYILLNKPKGYVSTVSDEKNRKTVIQLISRASKHRLYPVGRLDLNTTGLLLLTNDGEMTLKLTHPKHKVRKIYHVELDKNLKQEDLLAIRDGIKLEDGFIKPDKVEYVRDKPKNTIGIELHSGKNRIVRRLFEHINYNVIKLDRVVFAELTKKNLSRGKWRALTHEEVIALKMLKKN